MSKERYITVQIMPPARPAWIVFLQDEGVWAERLQGWALRKRITDSFGQPCDASSTSTEILPLGIDQYWLEALDQNDIEIVEMETEEEAVEWGRAEYARKPSTHTTKTTPGG